MGGHVARMRKNRDINSILLLETEGKKSLGISRCR